MNQNKITEIKNEFARHQVRLTIQDIYYLASIEEESLLAFVLADEYNCTPSNKDIIYLFDLLSP